MRPISRRAALQLGGLGLLGVAVGGAGLVWSGDMGLPGAGPGGGLAGSPGERFAEPEALHSSGGVLEVELIAAEQRLRVAGRDVVALAFNGGQPGPTLRLRPGDVVRLRLVNQLTEPTNLHVHGLVVSPAGNSDNVFLTVDAGAAFDYEYRLPADHPPGVFWYHPHLHHRVADQLFAGLFGAIVVEDPADLPVARERLLVVSDISFDTAGRVAAVSGMERMLGREGQLVLVNGRLRPVLELRPGERERWRVVNACSSRFLPLRLDGSRLQLLGLDSGRSAAARDVQEVLLAPGNRADLVVTVGEEDGVLRAAGHDRGGMAGTSGMGGPGPAGRRTGEPVDLAEVRLSGEPASPGPALTATAAAPDLRNAPIAARRRLVFGMGMGGGMGGPGGGMRFLIDGREFDPDRVDQTVALGGVEEWTIANTSPMDHPFHLHVWPMQVVARGGTPVEEVSRQDVVDVPARGEVTVRVAFDRFPGRTVFHCHILDHEDLGMMGVVEVR